MADITCTSEPVNDRALPRALWCVVIAAWLGMGALFLYRADPPVPAPVPAPPAPLCVTAGASCAYT